MHALSVTSNTSVASITRQPWKLITFPYYVYNQCVNIMYNRYCKITYYLAFYIRGTIRYISRTLNYVKPVISCLQKMATIDIAINEKRNHPSSRLRKVLKKLSSGNAPCTFCKYQRNNMRTRPEMHRDCALSLLAWG